MEKIIISLKIEKDKPLELKALSRAILSLNQGISDFVEQDKIYQNLQHKMTF